MSKNLSDSSEKVPYEAKVVPLDSGGHAHEEVDVYRTGGDHEHQLVETPGLKRQLKARHMAMISIGGVIGTGLFLGTGSALNHGGPLGLFLGYALMGSICYATMISAGEVIAYLPIAGGHITLSARFVDRGLAFAMGWNYWYNWTIILPAELSAAAVLINLWDKTTNNAAWISMCLAVVIIINLFGAGVYGECEFWFASIKVLTIVGLLIVGLVITCGGGPDHTSIGFRYWRHPGPFVQFNGIPGVKGRFLGFWAVLTQAAFSYIGTEILAIAAAEAKNPRRNLPRSIKRVYIRILVFYLGGTFMIGLLVPSNDKGLALNSGTALASPFVIAIQRSGIKVLPSFINACLLTSAWSAASSDLFTSSRALYGLAQAGQAPAFLRYTTKRGLPLYCVAISALFGSLAYMSLGETAGIAFGYLANMTAAAGLISWWGINLLYIRFAAGMRAQGIDRKTLPYWSYANTNSIAAYYAITMISIILFFSGFTVFLKGRWKVGDFVTTYIPLWLFPLLWVGYKLVTKAKFVRADDMDFHTGLAEVEADCYEEPPPRNFIERFWSWLM